MSEPVVGVVNEVAPSGLDDAVLCGVGNWRALCWQVGGLVGWLVGEMGRLLVSVLVLVWIEMEKKKQVVGRAAAAAATWERPPLWALQLNPTAPIGGASCN